MKNTLRTMRAKRAAGDSGFTLIELLVVVVIIGVLVAIAVPVYLNYRQGAANKTAQSDIRGAITAVEQYYTEYNDYPATNTTGTAGTAVVLGAAGSTVKVTVSARTRLKYYKGGTSGYVVCAVNEGGDATFKYDSNDGGSVAKVGDKSAYAACS